MISVAGQDYHILVERHKLLLAVDHRAVIDLTRLKLSGDEEFYLAYYQVRRHQIVELDPGELRQLPKDTVRIAIPKEYRLDPEGLLASTGLT